jgi:hypothetical protein
MSRADRIRNRGPLAEAQKVNEFHPIVDVQDVDGDTILVLGYDMENDPYCKEMPRAVRYNGKILGRTGYNSDTGQCYYKASASLVQEATVDVAEMNNLLLENRRLRVELEAAIRGREQLVVRVAELETAADQTQQREHIRNVMNDVWRSD